MTIDERGKEQEWTATNVRKLVPRRSASPSKIEQPQIFSPNGLLWSTAMMTRVLRPRDAVQ